MKLIERLSILSDSLETSKSNLEYIDTSAKFFMNSLPESIAEMFYIEEEIPVNGLQCGTKYSSVTRDGFICRPVPSNQKRLLKKPNTQYFVDKDDPVFYRENGKLFVVPDPSQGEKAYVFKIPSEFIEDVSNEDTETIKNVPENSYHVILLYAGFLIILKKGRDSRTASISYINSIGDSFDAFKLKLPDALDIPDFTYTGVVPVTPAITESAETFTVSFDAIPNLEIDIPLGFFDEINAISVAALSIGDYLTNFPSFTFTETMPGDSTSEFADASEAIQNAYKIIGEFDADKDTVPKGVYWLDDEDPEMVQSSVQLASQEVNRANAIINQTLNKVGEFSAKLDAASKKFEAEVTEITMKLDTDIKQMQAKIEEMRAKLELAVQKISAQIETKRLELESNRTHLEKANVNVQQELAKLQAAESSMTQRIQNNQQKLEHYSAKLTEFNSDFQKEANIYSVNLQKNLQQAQINIELASAELQGIQVQSSKFQMESNNYASLMNEARFMYERYLNELNMFLGIYGQSREDITTS